MKCRDFIFETCNNCGRSGRNSKDYKTFRQYYYILIIHFGITFFNNMASRQKHYHSIACLWQKKSQLKKPQPLWQKSTRNQWIPILDAQLWRRHFKMSSWILLRLLIHRQWAFITYWAVPRILGVSSTWIYALMMITIIAPALNIIFISDCSDRQSTQYTRWSRHSLCWSHVSQDYFDYMWPYIYSLYNSSYSILWKL